MFRILIVDDDKNFRRYFHAVLSHSGYQPFCADSATNALHMMETHKIDLLLTAALMPGTDGFMLTKMLRECGNTMPVIMIAPKHMAKDVKKGFLMGVEDYMVCPIDEDEMLLRIRALLRRSGIVSEHELKIGDTTLDYDTLTVSSRGEETILPQKEFYLLYKLLSYPNQIFTRDQLMDDIWGPESESTDATVSVHINRLRKRFANSNDFSIHTIRGLGYKACPRV